MWDFCDEFGFFCALFTCFMAWLVRRNCMQKKHGGTTGSACPRAAPSVALESAISIGGTTSYLSAPGFQPVIRHGFFALSA